MKIYKTEYLKYRIVQFGDGRFGYQWKVIGFIGWFSKWETNTTIWTWGSFEAVEKDILEKIEKQRKDRQGKKVVTIF